MEDPSNYRTARPLALVAGFATIYVLWGSTYLGIKLAITTLPPLLMAGWRFVLAGVMLYVVLRLRGSSAPVWRQWKLAILTATPLLLGGNGLVTWGQQYIASGRAALIVATTPLWMVIFAWLGYGGQRPRWRTWLGLAVGFAGAALLIKPPQDAIEGTIYGAIALALSPICWTLGSLQTRHTPPSDDPLMSSAMQMLIGGVMMLTLGTAVGEWPLFWQREVTTTSLLAFAYLVFAGVVGFATFTWLMTHASPAAVSTYAYVNPLVAVLLGWMFLGERMEPVVLVAAGLVVGAVVLITLPARQVRREKQPAPLVELPTNQAVCETKTRRLAAASR